MIRYVLIDPISLLGELTDLPASPEDLEITINSGETKDLYVLRQGKKINKDLLKYATRYGIKYVFHTLTMGKDIQAQLIAEFHLDEHVMLMSDLKIGEHAKDKLSIIRTLAEELHVNWEDRSEVAVLAVPDPDDKIKIIETLKADGYTTIQLDLTCPLLSFQKLEIKLMKADCAVFEERLLYHENELIKKIQKYIASLDTQEKSWTAQGLFGDESYRVIKKQFFKEVENNIDLSNVRKHVKPCTQEVLSKMPKHEFDKLIHGVEAVKLIEKILGEPVRAFRERECVFQELKVS